MMPGVTLSMKTRKDIEEEISSLKAEIENCKENYGDEAEMPEYIPELQQDLDALQAEYENAPAEIVWDGNESDGLLHSVAEMAQKEGGEDFYQWEYSLNPNGEVYYGANNGENDDYMSVFVQNNEERGNCLRYRRGKHGYDFTAIAVVYSTELIVIGSDVWPANEDRTQEYIDYKFGGESELVKFDDEPTTISEEEPEQQQMYFMENMGLA